MDEASTGEALIFKAVISRDDGCPWGDTGITSELWRNVAVRTHYIRNLIATQPGVLLIGLNEARPAEGGDYFPHVIEWRGDYYLEDGHHRVIRACLDGRTHIRTRHLVVT